MKASTIERIEKAIRLVPLEDPLRSPADALLDGEPVSPDGAELVLRRLEEPSRHGWRAVCVSAVLAGEIPWPPDQRARALAALRQLAPPQLPDGVLRGVGRGLRHGCLGALVLAAACVVGFVATASSIDSASAEPMAPLAAIVPLLIAFALGAVASTPFGAARGFLNDQRAWFAIREAALGSLGRLHDPTTVGLLAAAAIEPDEPIRRAAGEALLLVLPVLAAPDGSNLDPQVVPLLCRCLLRHTGLDAGDCEPRPAVAAAVLDALERVGSGMAVAAVKQVAERCSDAALQARARQVLPLLMERRAQERGSSFLLRPAEAPAGDALLRPASPSEEVPPEHLLRPAESEQG